MPEILLLKIENRLIERQNSFFPFTRGENGYYARVTSETQAFLEHIRKYREEAQAERSKRGGSRHLSLISIPETDASEKADMDGEIFSMDIEEGNAPKIQGTPKTKKKKWVKLSSPESSMPGRLSKIDTTITSPKQWNAPSPSTSIS
jgi:hypothetical protein